MRRILVSVVLLVVTGGTGAGAENVSARVTAKQIRIVLKAPSDCRPLGQVLGAYSKPYGAAEMWSASDSQVATAAAQEDMLGNAEKRGATHVVLEAVNSSRTTYTNTGFVTAAAYECSTAATR